MPCAQRAEIMLHFPVGLDTKKEMKRIFSGLFLLTGLCLLRAPLLFAQFSAPSVTILTTFDVPTGGETFPSGINDAGDIVGSYLRFGNEFGFERFANGKFKIIGEPPPRSTTLARGINNLGIICGMTGSEGFFYNGTAFTLYDAPDSTQTIINKENDLGDFVGSATINGVVVGFANIAGQFISLVIPGATLTTADGINNRDEIVGRYYDATGTYGFYRDPAGNLTYPITVQNSSFVNLNSINDRGEIAGDWADPAIGGYCHGFIMRLPHHVVSFDVPGSYNTSACDINNLGETTGYFYDFTGRGIHGFTGQLNQGGSK